MNGRASMYDQQGDLPAALAMQDAAVASLGQAAPSLRVSLLARRAELHAEAGDDLAAMRDLEGASVR